jgi:hypothetical protein
MSVEKLFEPSCDEMAESTDCLFNAVVDLYVGNATNYQVAILTHHSDEGTAPCVNEHCQSDCKLEYLSNGRAVPNKLAVINAGKRCIQIARLRTDLQNP